MRTEQTEGKRKKKQKEPKQPVVTRRRRDPAITARNKAQRIAKNAAQKSGKLPKHKRARYRRRAGLPIRYERIAAL